MRTAVCAIMRNEGRYLQEWVAYHLAVGFDALIIYDNGSTDNTVDELKRLGERAPITALSWPTPGALPEAGFDQLYAIIDGGQAPQIEDWIAIRLMSPQITAYNHALRTFGADFDWVLFIDADEFFVPLRDADAKSFLHRFHDNEFVGAVAVNEKYFGSAGAQTFEDRLVIERFPRCALPGFDGHLHVKSFIRPAFTEAMMIHGAKLKQGICVNERCDPANLKVYGLSECISMYYSQINHYSVKSFEEYEAKAKRGHAHLAEGNEKKLDGYGDTYFLRQDRNEDIDLAILRFLDPTRRIADHLRN